MNEKIYLKPLLLFGGGDTPGDGGEIVLPGSVVDPGDNPFVQSTPDSENPNGENGAPVEMP